MANVSASASGNPEPRPASSLPVPKSRRGIKGFFAEVKREMKKVSWPTKKETNRLTGVVLIVCGLCMAILWSLSFAFGAVIDMITKGGG